MTRDRESYMQIFLPHNTMEVQEPIPLLRFGKSAETMFRMPSPPLNPRKTRKYSNPFQSIIAIIDRALRIPHPDNQQLSTLNIVY